MTQDLNIPLFFSNFRKNLRSCILCSSYLVQVSYICTTCERKLILKCMTYLGFSRELGFPHYYVFPWSKENDSWLRPLVYGLKGGGPKEVFQQVAHWMLLNRIEQGISKKLKFTYVPGKKRDHSFCLAQALAEKLGTEKQEGCFMRRGGTQKSKSIYERSLVGFKKVPSWSLCEGEGVVLVDDVVTTGATAKAIFKALERPRNFEVWSLVKRMRVS